jgi:SAM-dependent methyltransferase
MDCPVCGSVSLPADAHPQVELYRCPRCTHRFSLLKPGVQIEPYDAAYFEQTHKNWFAHPNIGLFERITRLIDGEPAPRAVIDVGCGKGDLLRYLAGRPTTQATLTGVDLIKNKPDPKVRFIEGDALAVDLADQFSVVVTMNTIEHVADVHAFVQRIKSLTRPGGLVIIQTPNDASLLYLTARIARRLGVALPFNRIYDRHHLHHFTPASFARLLESEGLQRVSAIMHNVPIAAIDIPVSSPAAEKILRMGVQILFGLGALTGKTYSQTAIYRRPAAYALRR